MQHENPARAHRELAAVFFGGGGAVQDLEMMSRIFLMMTMMMVVTLDPDNDGLVPYWGWMCVPLGL